MHRYAAILAAAALLGHTAVARGESPIGTVVPPYPEGLVDLAGSCLAQHEICDWSIAVLAAPPPPYWPDIRDVHLYAQRAAGHAPDGQAFWIVTDIIRPPEADGYAIEGPFCSEDGGDFGEIYAMVRPDPKAETWDDVIWAVRLDYETGRFVQLDPSKVTCEVLHP